MLALRCFILNHQEVNNMSYELLRTASNVRRRKNLTFEESDREE
jgi:hypothetical protein